MMSQVNDYFHIYNSYYGAEEVRRQYEWEECAQSVKGCNTNEGIEHAHAKLTPGVLAGIISKSNSIGALFEQ